MKLSEYKTITGGILFLMGMFLINKATEFSVAIVAKANLMGGSIDLNGSTSELEFSLKVILIFAGISMFFFGAWLVYLEQKHKFKTASTKQVFAIQLSGLSNMPLAPIVDAIPQRFEGRRTTRDIDVRQMLSGGHRIAEAIAFISQIGVTLQADVGQMNPSDYEIFAGGLAPVPLLFQLGNILEDETSVHWLDWQREQRQWVDTMNGSPVQIWPKADVSNICSKEIVLIADISYPVSESIVAKAFPNLPILKWGPDDKQLGVIFSKNSSDEVCENFRALLLDLSSRGVEKVHFVLAASSGLSMRLGSCYDARNMLPVIVYQYEKEAKNPYPWGVKVSVLHGEKRTYLIPNVNTVKE